MFILKNKEHSNQHISFTGNFLLRYFVKVEHRSCLAFFRAKYNFLINLKGRQYFHYFNNACSLSYLSVEFHTFEFPKL